MLARNFKYSTLIWAIRVCQLLGVPSHEYLPARWSCDDPMTASRCSNVSIAMGYSFWQVYGSTCANFNPAPLSKKAVMSFNKKE